MPGTPAKDGPLKMPESVLERIRRTGMRPSAARIGVVQVLHAAEPEPLGAEDMYRRLSQRGTRASLGTVYRVLNELEAHGLLLREWGAGRKALYRIKPAGFDEHRLRLVCQDCGHSVAFSDRALLTALERVAHTQGLALAGKAVAIPCECRGATPRRPNCAPVAWRNRRASQRRPTADDGLAGETKHPAHNTRR